MFLSTMQTLPFEGHNVAYQCTGLDLSNNVREYEVNRLTNEKTTLTQIVNAAGQIHQSLSRDFLRKIRLMIVVKEIV